MIMSVPISHLSSANFCFICFKVLLLGTCTCCISIIMLKSSNMIMSVPISHLSSANFRFIYFEVLLLGTCTLVLYDIMVSVSFINMTPFNSGNISYFKFSIFQLFLDQCCMANLFPFLHFELIYVFIYKVILLLFHLCIYLFLQRPYSQVVFSHPN